MLKARIETLLATYAEAWSRNDPEALAACWDESEPYPFYKAEEVDHFLRSHADILAYWQHNQRFHHAVRLVFSALDVQELAPNIALVILQMRWDIRFAADAKTEDGAPFPSAGKAMGGDNHVLVMVRERGDDVRIIGWSETPDAPISYMRKLYEAVAAKDI